MNTVDILKKQEKLLKEVDFLAIKHTQNERKTFKLQLSKDKKNISS